MRIRLCEQTMMWTALFAVTLIATVTCTDVRQLVFGPCIELCSDDASCGDGYFCQSNGCGHECAPIIFKRSNMLRQLIGICVEECVVGGCPAGMECLSNGCGHTCQTVFTTDVRRERQIGICAELCPAAGCPDGQSCVSNGCGHVCA